MYLSRSVATTRDRLASPHCVEHEESRENCTVRWFWGLRLEVLWIAHFVDPTGHHYTAREESSDSRGDLGKRRGDFAERSLSGAKTECEGRRGVDWLVTS